MKNPAGHFLVALLLVAIVLGGVFKVLSPWEMTGAAQVALAILLIAAVLWISEIVPLFVTSLIILALSITWLKGTMDGQGIEVTKTLFMAPFFSDIILLFMGGFVMASAMHKFQIDEQMARWVIAKTGSSTPKLMLGIMAITALLSMFLSNTATTAMMMTLCLPIIAGLPAGDRHRKAILLSVPFAANVGGIGTPIGTPPNAIALKYLRELADYEAPSFGMWMVMAVPLVIVLLLAIWGILLLMYRGKGSVIALPQGQEPPPWSWQTYLVVIVSGLTVLGWLTGKMHGLSTGTVALLPVLVLFGSRVLTVQDLRALSWDVLLLMGGGLCLGAGIGASGLAEWLIQQVPTGMTSMIVLVVIFGTVTALLSCVISNTAAANLILPILVGLNNPSVAPIMIVVAYCCSFAMAMPVSTPPNAIAFSTGELRVKDMFKPGIAILALGLVLVFTVVLWWLGVLGVA